MLWCTVYSVSQLDLVNTGPECGQDYLVLRNGASQASPLFLLNPAQVLYCPVSGDCTVRAGCPAERPAVRDPARPDQHHGRGPRRPLRVGRGGGRPRLQVEVPGAQWWLRGHRPAPARPGGGTHRRCNRDIMSHFSQVVSSPGHPNAPPAHTECEWRLLSPPGTQIHLDIEELSVHSRQQLQYHP